MSRLQYGRIFGRLLIVAVVLATLVFPFIPEESEGVVAVIRVVVGTFGFGFASIWAPALLYAGLRTQSTIDSLAGVVGLLTLIFWIPTMIYDW